ncbi:helix-turn-helix domain-containing protein [Barnesiella propionica]|uniref:helix-turn-helix domain-containing protein n=1 Tax=Barnesiella propionica TaxID=2981781 RepID=UPI0011CBC192|nr:helix-turn-helix domain-containing protein [Barnesiella propionica]MCU6769620.1 helix-turn-helix domain-containing protein [Barnesiella propionica]
MNSKADYNEPGGDLITKDNPRIMALLRSFDRVLERMELMARNCKPLLNGEYYMTDKEVSERLKVSRQTLQEYRNTGKIAYCQLGGKILYRASDIQKMLDENYREAY